MADVKNFLIIVNTGADKPYNQYAAYVLAFVAKQVQKIENVRPWHEVLNYDYWRNCFTTIKKTGQSK